MKEAFDKFFNNHLKHPFEVTCLKKKTKQHSIPSTVHQHYNLLTLPMKVRIYGSGSTCSDTKQCQVLLTAKLAARPSILSFGVPVLLRSYPPGS